MSKKQDLLQEYYGRHTLSRATLEDYVKVSAKIEGVKEEEVSLRV